MAKKVAVIGGGVAGMSAAAALAEQGFNVTLYEAREKLGGRTSSLFDYSFNDWVDNGPHLFLNCYNHFFKFLTSINAFHKIRFQKVLTVHFLERGDRRFLLRGMPLPGILGMLGSILTYSAISLKDRIRILKLFSQCLGDSGRVSLPDSTITNWLEAAGQSDRVRKFFWNPLAAATLNERPEIASAAAFRQALTVCANGSLSLAYSTVTFNKLFEPEFTGFMVKNGGKVELKCSITGFKIDNNAAACALTRNGDAIEADYYIVCVPPYSLLKLLPFYSNLSFSYSPIVSVYLRFDSAPELFKDGFACLIDGNFEWLFDFSGIWTDMNVVCFLKSGARDLVDKDNEQLESLAVQEMRDFFPRCRAGMPVHAMAVREKQATVSLTPDICAQRQGNKTPYKNIFIAGDWTDTGLPATIEGAAKSGHAAAEMVEGIEGRSKMIQ